jgi:hypothetical protein
MVRNEMKGYVVPSTGTESSATSENAQVWNLSWEYSMLLDWEFGKLSVMLDKSRRLKTS